MTTKKHKVIEAAGIPSDMGAVMVTSQTGLAGVAEGEKMLVSEPERYLGQAAELAKVIDWWLKSNTRKRSEACVVLGLVSGELVETWSRMEAGGAEQSVERARAASDFFRGAFDVAQARVRTAARDLVREQCEPEPTAPTGNAS